MMKRTTNNKTKEFNRTNSRTHIVMKVGKEASPRNTQTVRKMEKDRERERQREREREPALAVTSGYFFLFGFFGFCG